MAAKSVIDGCFAGKKVLITGASRGLGLQFTRRLAAAGSVVYASCRSPKTAAALQEVCALYPERVIACELDTADARSVATLANSIPVLDVLVNNAGIVPESHPNDPMIKVDLNVLDSVLRTNLHGPIATTKAFLQQLERGEQKLVVTISSDLASIGKCLPAEKNTMETASYRISKAAVNMAMRLFAAELDNLTVVAMSPGWVDTDMGSRGGRTPPLTPEQSVDGMLHVLAGLKLADTGKFLKYDGSEVPW